MEKQKVTHLHFNNHISSKQDFNKFARQLADAIIFNGNKIVTVSVDDGDGDVWKYEITIDSNRVAEVKQINEN